MIFSILIMIAKILLILSAYKTLSQITGQKSVEGKKENRKRKKKRMYLIAVHHSSVQNKKWRKEKVVQGAK